MQTEVSTPPEYASTTFLARPIDFYIQSFIIQLIRTHSYSNGTDLYPLEILEQWELQRKLMFFSVVIPTYNRKAHFREVLES